MAVADRIFWGIIAFIFVCLFWLKYLERFASIWVGAFVAALTFAGILAFARPKGEASRSVLDLGRKEG